MKFIVLSFASMAALAQAAFTPGASFGLLTIRSGSPVHLTSPSISDNKLVLGSSSDYFTGTFTTEGYVKVKGTDLYLAVASDKSIVLSSTPSTFDVDGTYFSADGTEGFSAVLENSVYALYSGDVTTTNTKYNVIFRVLWDESSSGASSVASSTAKTSTVATSSAVHTTSAAHNSTATHTTSVIHTTATPNATATHSPSHNATVSPTVPQVNGASFGANINCAVAVAAGIVGSVLFL
ncbi:uncharacterized protein SAPINGB_P002780 [Magnusiomyces paraingens]|uniref:Uncharacterized protein n=1 Tax=Magnusiomyces paraingens TaxID=2606893 RepID=A0A5E8BLG4_9ASCO|nr:uncharacterized protein SAPINGB_P002780 [Saprochaete ingens]VVT50488.1 unnamed protein product [Saprochaete ingens]